MYVVDVDMQKSGFPGAAVPCDGQALPLGDSYAAVPEGMHPHVPRPVNLLDAFCLNDSHEKTPSF